MKDLVDLVLFVESGGLDQQKILDSLHQTFDRRETQLLPDGLVPPPPEWQISLQSLAEECGLPSDVTAGFLRVQTFFEDVLSTRTER